MAISNEGLKRDHEAADRLLRAQNAGGEDVPDFEMYRGKTVDFVKDVWGFESARRRTDGSPYQFEIMQDVDECPQVAVRSGHGVGKTTTDALTALGFLLSRPFSRVVVVMPEFSRQVRSIFFAELKKWVRRAKIPLPLEMMSNRVLVRGFGDEWSIHGMPATEPERIEGFHSEAGVLLILDETKGVPDECYDALMGCLTGHGENRLLVTSTPGSPSGVFYSIFVRGGDDWRLHHIPSTDSSLVTKKWVEQRKREWGGEESSQYQMRVAGNFMSGADEGLIQLKWLEAAAERWPNAMCLLDRDRRRGTLPEPTIAVDPARYGPDATVLAVRRGNTLERFASWGGISTMETVERIRQEAAQEGARPASDSAPAWGTIVVDGIGIGAGVVDRLKELRYQVVEFNGGFRAGKRDKFLNGRSESFWNLRDRFEEGRIALPRDDALVEELLGIRWKATPTDQVQLEEKSALKGRLGRSPDRADALSMVFYEVTTYLSGWGTYVI